MDGTDSQHIHMRCVSLWYIKRGLNESPQNNDIFLPQFNVELRGVLCDGSNRVCFVGYSSSS